jgi:stearoyl-CoA desaturase (Delta-9 desaturase)
MNDQKIWWSNAFFFMATHIAAGLGVYHRPPGTVAPPSLLLAFVIWQASQFGYTFIL